MSIELQEVRELISQVRPDLALRVGTTRTLRELRLLVDLSGPPAYAAECPVAPASVPLFDVVLTRVAPAKEHSNISIETIKAIREFGGFGLKDAKDIHDEVVAGHEVPVVKGCTWDVAKRAEAGFSLIGARTNTLAR